MMDIQCPANLVCLRAGEPVPVSVAGQRVVAVYLFDVEDAPEDAHVPVRLAPSKKLWLSLRQIADAHRGEGAVVYAPEELLDRAWLNGVSLSMTSAGAERIQSCG